jgi:hypothetical protein
MRIHHELLCANEAPWLRLLTKHMKKLIIDALFVQRTVIIAFEFAIV